MDRNISRYCTLKIEFLAVYCGNGVQNIRVATVHIQAKGSCGWEGTMLLTAFAEFRFRQDRGMLGVQVIKGFLKIRLLPATSEVCPSSLFCAGLFHVGPIQGLGGRETLTS